MVTKTFASKLGGASEIWTDLVEWLVFRGARKVIVASDCQAQLPHLTRRLDLLRRLYNAKIHCVSGKIQTKEHASEFLTEIRKIGDLGAVFVLPVKAQQLKQSDIKPVQYLDMALRNMSPKTLFVNLLSGAFGINQNRSDGEFRGYNVEWPETVEFGEVLSALDDILALRIKHVVIKSAKVSDIMQESTQALYKSKIHHFF